MLCMSEPSAGGHRPGPGGTVCCMCLQVRTVCWWAQTRVGWCCVLCVSTGQNCLLVGTDQGRVVLYAVCVCRSEPSAGGHRPGPGGAVCCVCLQVRTVCWWAQTRAGWCSMLCVSAGQNRLLVGTDQGRVVLYAVCCVCLQVRTVCWWAQTRVGGSVRCMLYAVCVCRSELSAGGHRPGPGGTVCCMLCVSAGQNRLLVGTDQGRVVLYAVCVCRSEPSAGEHGPGSGGAVCCMCLQVRTVCWWAQTRVGWCCMLCVSAGQNRLLVGTDQGRVVLYAVCVCRSEPSAGGHRPGPGGAVCCVCLQVRTVCWWAQTRAGWCCMLCVSAGQNRLLVGTDQGRVVLYAVCVCRSEPSAGGHRPGVGWCCMLFVSAGQNRLLVGTDQGRVVLYAVCVCRSEPSAGGHRPGPGGAVCCMLCVSAGQNRLLVGTDQGRVVLHAVCVCRSEPSAGGHRPGPGGAVCCMYVVCVCRSEPSAGGHRPGPGGAVCCMCLQVYCHSTPAYLLLGRGIKKRKKRSEPSAGGHRPGPGGAVCCVCMQVRTVCWWAQTRARWCCMLCVSAGQNRLLVGTDQGRVVLHAVCVCRSEPSAGGHRPGPGGGAVCVCMLYVSAGQNRLLVGTDQGRVVLCAVCVCRSEPSAGGHRPGPGGAVCCVCLQVRTVCWWAQTRAGWCCMLCVSAGQNRLLVGTDQGRVVLYDAAEMKAEFRLTDVLRRGPGADADRRSVNATRSGSVISGGGTGTPVTSIVTFSKARRRGQASVMMEISAVTYYLLSLVTIHSVGREIPAVLTSFCVGFLVSLVYVC